MLFPATLIAGTDPLRRSRQCLVVLSENWNATTGRLRSFERQGTGWKLRGPAIPVVLGKKGLAWGIGLF
ncbi:MAG TPA: hypothetical protein VF511_07510, partial [Chthoniobacterales bacterium]